MKLRINGELKDLQVTTVADLVTTEGYSGNYFAVAVNMACVARDQYAMTAICEGDEIEILTPMQGG